MSSTLDTNERGCRNLSALNTNESQFLDFQAHNLVAVLKEITKVNLYTFMAPHYLDVNVLHALAMMHLEKISHVPVGQEGLDKPQSLSGHGKMSVPLTVTRCQS